MRMLSRFEKKQSYTAETFSQIKKMVVVNYISVGLLITLNSFDRNFYTILPGGSQNKHQFSFTEFTVEWYRKVGPTIQMAVLFLVVTPHASNGSFHILNWARRRIWD